MAGCEVLAISPRDARRLELATVCAYCERTYRPGELEAEHVVPVDGHRGRYAIGNLVPVCKPCNSSKRNRLLVEVRYRSDLVCKVAATAELRARLEARRLELRRPPRQLEPRPTPELEEVAA
jgi:5-methylcytosine-specific restriction endonuclease McrA